MRKLRKIGKMAYPNDGGRNLFDSILNYNVLLALKTLINNNTFDFILINDLVIGYHHKPYRVSSIDILVKNKDKKVNYFPNFKYYKNNNITINVYNIDDFGLSLEDYDIIKNHTIISNGINIISPTFQTILLVLCNGFDYKIESSISKLIYNSKVNLNILEKYLSILELKNINDLIVKNNKNYMMKYLENYNKYNICKIYEGSSGYAEVDVAFSEWIKNTNNINQVLIGGMALVNYDLDKKRTTQDVNFLLLQKDDIPDNVVGFKKHRNGAFQHNKTHVEIEVLTSSTINTSDELVDLVFKTSYQKDSYRIASPSAIVALKLGRFNSINDKNDIISLIKGYDIDINSFMPYLSDIAIKNWNYILSLNIK